MNTTAKTAGSHAGFRMVLIDGHFYHINKDDIIDTTADGIERLIVKTILEDDVAGKLKEAQEELEVMKKYLDENSAEVVELKAKVGKLQGRIDAVRSITEGSDATRVARLHPQTEVYGGSIRVYEQVLVDGQIVRGDLIASTAADLRITQEVFNIVRRHVEEVARKAYEEGYKDGYKAGYKDGYNAAVTDLNN